MVAGYPQWDDVSGAEYQVNIRNLQSFLKIELSALNYYRLSKLLQYEIFDALLAMIKSLGTVEPNSRVTVDDESLEKVEYLLDLGELDLAERLFSSLVKSCRTFTGILRLNYIGERELILVYETGKSVVIVNRVLKPLKMLDMIRIVNPETFQAGGRMYSITSDLAGYNEIELYPNMDAESLLEFTKQLQRLINLLLSSI